MGIILQANVSADDFGLFSLFWNSGFLVKLVILIMIAMSIWAWAIVVQKIKLFREVRQDLDGFLSRFWSGQALTVLLQEIGANPNSDAEKIFVGGMEEWTSSYKEDGALIPNASMRIERVMQVRLNQARDVWENGLTVLATVGSTAPFVGLFGTVWGIKNAFSDIAVSQSTNLSVVAPGIAEALLATAIGLFAAIPAVIFYNKLSQDADRLSSDHEMFVDEFSMILAREIDQGV